jgi:hypothetical protein
VDVFHRLKRRPGDVPAVFCVLGAIRPIVQHQGRSPRPSASSRLEPRGRRPNDEIIVVAVSRQHEPALIL